MTPEQRASRDRRQAVIDEAEKVYRWALEDYNDGIRAARKAYDAAVAKAQAQWVKENR